MYVCDSDNNHIQVFDTDLNFIQSIDSPGLGMEKFNKPYDLDFDSQGKAYVADSRNNRIVLDTCSCGWNAKRFDEGEEKLDMPRAIHVIGEFIYVSDWGHDRIVVYRTSGHFVTSFGKRGERKGELREPYGITSDQDGLVYVADHSNNRVQVF